MRDFLKKLEKENLLKRITHPVSTVLEITEIHKRVIEKRGPALLFENVITENGKSDIPVLVNLFGSIERIALALGKKEHQLRDLGRELAFLRQPKPPKNIKEALNSIDIFRRALKMKPKIVKKAQCQEIILKGNDVDLTKLPIQTCWPNEPAPLITWPLVVTRGPNPQNEDIDNYNLGIYRMQLLSKNQTLMRWLKHRGGAQQYKRWQNSKKNNPLPVAVIIGADPIITLAAVTPIPENISEYNYAGLLGNKKIQLVDCKTIPLKVPATAEIILEGHVSLDDYRNEGPYGDHTGYYNSVEKFPVFTISAITMRKNPIYLSTYTGKPDDEPSILGEAMNEILIPLLTQQFPEISDFYLPPEGCSYRIAIVAIKKSYPGHAKKIMKAIWSFLNQFSYTKFIIVVDNDIDIRNWKEVMWAISTKSDSTRDVTLIKDCPIDYLDFASCEESLGGKMGIDATNKIYPETKREWGREIEMSEEIIKKVDKIWHNLNL